MTSITDVRNLRSERFFSLLVCLHLLTKKVAQKGLKIDSIGVFYVVYGLTMSKHPSSPSFRLFLL